MQKIIKYLLLSLSVTPILIDKSLIFSSISTKTFFVSGIILITSLLFLIELIKNNQFRGEVSQKILSIKKNPIIIGLSIFIFISLVSVFFAKDTYLSLWGEIERGEGFINLISMVVLSLFLYFQFKKNDWILFGKLNILISIPVISYSIIQFIQGIQRPGSFLENPAFLSGYLIFIIGIAMTLFIKTKSLVWKYISSLVLLFSIISIFFTQTRSSLIGVFIGLVATLFYFLFKSDKERIYNFSLKKIATVIVFILVISSVVFLITKENNFWKNIPGINRITEINSTTGTGASRLFSWKSGLQSVNPILNTKEFFIGWGLENTNLALAEYYNPLQYKYDPGYFDRTHNKFLDIFVMTGIFGLLAYLFIWFSLFRVLINKKFSVFNSIIIFTLSAYFIHLFFIFDQTLTSLFFFSTIALLISIDQKDSLEKINNNRLISVITVIFLIILIGFILRGNVVSYIQLKRYFNLVNPLSIEKLETSPKLNFVFKPFSPVQSVIQKHFIETSIELSGDIKKQPNGIEKLEKLLNFSTQQGETYILRRETDFKFLSVLAAGYDKKFEITEAPDDLLRSENLMRKALLFAPERQELNNNLVFNLVAQNRLDEALEIINKNIQRDVELAVPYYYKGFVLFESGELFYNESLLNFEKSFDMDQLLFQEYKFQNIKNYGSFLKFFYKKDKESFIKTGKRLIENEYPAANSLKEIINLVETGIWPLIEFK